MNPNPHQLQISSNDSSLSATSGCITLFKGAVGSGKSLWLQRLAGLEPLPQGVDCSLDGKPWPDRKSRAVRMHFDQWPPIWLGQTVGDELRFGLPTQPAAAELQATLAAWGLPELPLARDTQRLNRLQAIRLSLAAMQLAAPALALIDNPLGSLPEADADTLAADIAAWAGGTDIIVVVACNRWHSWRHRAEQVWHLHAGDTTPTAEASVE